MCASSGDQAAACTKNGSTEAQASENAGTYQASRVADEVPRSIMNICCRAVPAMLVKLPMASSLLPLLDGRKLKIFRPLLGRLPVTARVTYESTAPVVRLSDDSAGRLTPWMVVYDPPTIR